MRSDSAQRASTTCGLNAHFDGSSSALNEPEALVDDRCCQRGALTSHPLVVGEIALLPFPNALLALAGVDNPIPVHVGERADAQLRGLHYGDAPPLGIHDGPSRTHRQRVARRLPLREQRGGGTFTPAQHQVDETIAQRSGLTELDDTKSLDGRIVSLVNPETPPADDQRWRDQGR
jgi:hypothetical protein